MGNPIPPTGTTIAMPRAVADQLRPSVREMYLNVFATVAEPIRLRMLLLIASTGDDEYFCSDLESSLPIGKSTISYHVKIIAKAGLIDVRREGRFFRYRARREVIDFFLPELLERLDVADFENA